MNFRRIANHNATKKQNAAPVWSSD
jgi:hypothetical protein